MVQKIGAQYIGKKLCDTLMAPPQPVQVEDEQGVPVQVDASARRDLTGQTITDERGGGDRPCTTAGRRGGLRDRRAGR